MYGKVELENLFQVVVTDHQSRGEDGEHDYASWLLTHAIWHNGYGGSAETGIRQGDRFSLCQHGSHNWGQIAEWLTRCLISGRSMDVAARLVERLADRHRNRRTRA